jgi:hypothetical protein
VEGFMAELKKLLLTLRGKRRIASSVAAYGTEYLPENPHRKGYFDEAWPRRSDGATVFATAIGPTPHAEDRQTKVPSPAGARRHPRLA